VETLLTVPGRLFRTTHCRGQGVAFRECRGPQWTDLTWEQVGRAVRDLAAGLIDLGVKPQGRVVVWGHNSARWVLADLAIQTCSGITVPVYETSTAGQAEHILQETEAEVVFLDLPQYLALASAREVLTPGPLRAVVLIRGALPERRIPGVRSLSWEELTGRAAAAQAGVEERLGGLTPEAPATIVYTSGTCGQPRGALFDHRAITRLTDMLLWAYPAGPGDCVLSYLPLAHSIERLMSVFLPVTVGGTVWFAENMERMPANLRHCRPTCFVGVPRVWEKFAEAIRARAAGASAWRRGLFRVARAVGARAQAAQARGRRPPHWLRLAQRACDRLVGDRLRAALGLDRARYLISGGAPLRPDVKAFLHAVGLPVLDAYGQTETIVTSGNTPAASRWGSVGRPLPGTAVRIAASGEIEVQSEGLFRGYWRRPRDTEDSFTPDGWLRTGDLGRLDGNGFLSITGRKKGVLVTSGGKKIAPEPLEMELAAIPGVAQAVVIGEGEKYLVALLTLDPGWPGRPAPAGREADGRGLAADPRLLQAIQAEVDRVNSRRPPFEQIKYFHLLPEPFTVEAQELTPTLKVRRGVIAARYAELIKPLYARPRWAGRGWVAAAPVVC
jgi:long-chain acyl-CoA synthetase